MYTFSFRISIYRTQVFSMHFDQSDDHVSVSTAQVWLGNFTMENRQFAVWLGSW